MDAQPLAGRAFAAQQFGDEQRAGDVRCRDPENRRLQMPCAQQIAGEPCREIEAVEVTRLGAVMRYARAEEGLRQKQHRGDGHVFERRFLRAAQHPFFHRRRFAVPAQIVELAERQQDEGYPAQKEDEADARPQQRRTGRTVSRQRIVRKIVGVGVAGAGPLRHRSPGRPGEEGRELVKLHGVGNQIGGQSAIARRILEIVLPARGFQRERLRARRKQSERIGRRIVAVGLQQRRDFAVHGGAFAARKRGVVFGKPRLRPLPGQVLRPVMQHGCAEIGAQIAAMAPDRAVVHESVFEKHRLARAHIVAGEDGLPGGVHGARGYRRRVLIGLERQKDQHGEAENERQRDGARPPRRKLFDGFIRLCAGHDAPDPVARFTNKIDPRPRHRKALRQGSAALSPENEYERPLRDSHRLRFIRPGQGRRRETVQKFRSRACAKYPAAKDQVRRRQESEL